MPRIVLCEGMRQPPLPLPKLFSCANAPASGHKSCVNAHRSAPKTRSRVKITSSSLDKTLMKSVWECGHFPRAVCCVFVYLVRNEWVSPMMSVHIAREASCRDALEQSIYHCVEIFRVCVCIKRAPISGPHPNQTHLLCLVMVPPGQGFRQFFHNVLST